MSLVYNKDLVHNFLFHFIREKVVNLLGGFKTQRFDFKMTHSHKFYRC